MRFFFSSVVESRDHFDRLTHRATLVADDRTVSDQHIPAAPKRLGIGCVNDAAFHTRLHAAVCHDRLQQKMLSTAKWTAYIRS